MEADLVYILKDYRLWHKKNGKMIIFMNKNYFHFFILGALEVEGYFKGEFIWIGVENNS